MVHAPGIPPTMKLPTNGVRPDIPGVVAVFNAVVTLATLALKWMFGVVTTLCRQAHQQAGSQAGRFVQ